MLSLLSGCREGEEVVRPVRSGITESVYASGTIRSLDQYEVYAAVSGTIQAIPVREGDTVVAGQVLVLLESERADLEFQNAALASRMAERERSAEQINAATRQVVVARNRMRQDSADYARQQRLWEQRIGSAAELEQRELAFRQAAGALAQAEGALESLNNQIRLKEAQSANTQRISGSLREEYRVSSRIDGKVYRLDREVGEYVTPQSRLAIVGQANRFLLDLRVDEPDLLKVEVGQTVWARLDSYPEQVFEAEVSRIEPLIDPQNKTFRMEALFRDTPPKLFPNISVEANIVIQSKADALLIPRNLLLNDSLVIRSNGDTLRIKTGLRDFRMVEVLSGLQANDELRPLQP